MIDVESALLQGVWTFGIGFVRMQVGDALHNASYVRYRFVRWVDVPDIGPNVRVMKLLEERGELNPPVGDIEATHRVETYFRAAQEELYRFFLSGYVFVARQDGASFNHVSFVGRAIVLFETPSFPPPPAAKK
jgi:hypothetical protein